MRRKLAVKSDVTYLKCCCRMHKFIANQLYLVRMYSALEGEKISTMFDKKLQEKSEFCLQRKPYYLI